MNFTFENQGTNTYLVYQVKPEDKVDSMSLGMLTNNKIGGLAPALFMQIDTTKYIKYNVSSKVSVKQFFAGPVNKKRLIGVFTGIVDAMLSAEEYMIDPDTILLDLDYIFADVSTCETVLVCLPIMNKENNTDLGTFFKNIVFSTQFDQTENCDYVAKIINYLNSTPVFLPTDFSELLRGIKQNGGMGQATVIQQSKPQPVVQQPVAQEKKKQQVQPKPVQQPINQQVIQPQQPIQQQQSVAQQPIQPISQPNQGFAIPGQKPVQPKQVPNQNVRNAQPTESGEKMSMFYLLQHYNKENAAAYKAQKEAQKAGKKAGSVPNNVGMAMPGAKVSKTPIQPQNMGMAIPGQKPQPQQGLAIPGQKPQPQQNFAIPGQPAQSPVGAGQPNKPAQPQAYNNFTQPQNVAPASQPTPVQPTPVATPIQPIQTAPQGQPMNFGETTVLGGATFGETTVLNAGMMQQEIKVQPYLIRSKNNERIELNKPVFRIGKEKSYVDYFISDNTAISRSHANVISRDGEYFVVDTNSTNHTYVNGMMIQSNVETKIADGAKIRLANEDFEFKMR